MAGYVYIMANKKDGTNYTGVTSDLIKRDYEHKHGITGGFTKKYNLHKLVYFQIHDTIEDAIAYEKKIKNRGAAFKKKLIERDNPEWNDLSSEINR